MLPEHFFPGENKEFLGYFCWVAQVALPQEIFSEFVSRARKLCERYITDDTPIDLLNELSTRTMNCFGRSNIKTVGEARRLSDIELMRLPLFGRKSFNEWKAFLAAIAVSTSSHSPIPN